MTKTTIPVFKKTLEKTEDWLHEIMDLLNWDDPQQAYRALRVVLHTLRDRLTVAEATDLAAQLPMLIRGIYFEGWNPAGKPNNMRTAEEFVDNVNQHFPTSNFEEYFDAEDISRAVLTVLASHVTQGEIDDVIGSLPMSIRELWHRAQ